MNAHSLKRHAVEVGFREALLRWKHPDLGLVSLDSFISIAEDTDLIISIGKYVLTEACKQAAAWQFNGLHNIPIAINLSARQFRDRELSNHIRTELDKYGLDPKLLGIELTETMLMDDIGQSIFVLNQLKQMCLKISINDFDTGYSSLNYLK